MDMKRDKMIPPVKLGWMAGVIDLKGKIYYKNNRMRNPDSRQIVMLVETKNINVIHELGALTGTSPDLKKAIPLKEFMRKGCTDHCPEPHVHVNELNEDSFLPPVARWTITGAGLAVVIHNLLPFLVNNKIQCEAAMVEAMEHTPLAGQGSTAALKSIRRLSLLGWDLPEQYEIAME